MCGKYKKHICLEKSWLGSPPYVREVHRKFLVMSFLYRITPACAGSTRLSKRLISRVQDHPRMCGKYEPPASIVIDR